MTTCPRCGRVADEEIVCPDCGMSLALARRASETAVTADLTDALGFGDEAAPAAPDVRVWRLGALVLACCVFAAAAAFLLLRQHGSGQHDTALPVSSTSSSTGPTPSSSSAATSTGAPTQPVARTSATPSTTKPASSHGEPSSSAVTSGSSQNQGSSPRSSLASATRTVHAAQGALDESCGRHCYRLVVTLSAFPAGSHRVTCWALRGGVFGSYTTSSTTSTGCAYRHPHDSVWVIVDGRYRSNTVSW